MKRADFLDANLSGADLQSTYLLGANFKGARIENTNIDGADLTDASWVDGTQCINKKNCWGKAYSD